MSGQTLQTSGQQQLQRDHPVTIAEVMAEVEERAARGDFASFQPLSTGFSPLDDVLNGGLRPGELMIVGGPFGVGKTIFGLQTARNVARSDEDNRAIYICYEHDPFHLMSRLFCLESAEAGTRREPLTLRNIAELVSTSNKGLGLVSKLRNMPRHAQMLRDVDTYASRLVLVRASGIHGTLDRIRQWVEQIADTGAKRVLLVIDYLQKIPVGERVVQSEAEATTYVTQGLKELAVSMGIRVIAIAASDRQGLKSRRMRLVDLRGGSALQYEADIGIVLHNKHAIISREHLLFSPTQAEAMRHWLVMSIEKNRAGANAVDMEYALDGAHFRLAQEGGFVRERLVDERVVLR
jgi:replicative DNA helicase